MRNMDENYLKWSERKRFLESKRGRALFHERELWWCSIGLNIGHEENGKGERFARPVVIFKKFGKKTFWGIPVTTKFRKDLFYVAVTVGDDRKRWAIVSQMRFFDARRLLGKIGTVGTSDHHFMVKAVTDISTA